MNPLAPYMAWIKLGALLAVLAFIGWKIHAYGEARYDDGQAVIQSKWDADVEETQAKTRKLEAEAAAARAAYGDKVLADQTKYDEGVRDAYARGKAAGAAIAAGAVRVRTVWRDQCPKTPAGAGTEPGAGTADVAEGRADAIGRVLGEAGSWDKAYERAYGRLIEAQKLLNVCYEKPAP